MPGGRDTGYHPNQGPPPRRKPEAVSLRNCNQEGGELSRRDYNGHRAVTTQLHASNDKGVNENSVIQRVGTGAAAGLGRRRAEAALPGPGRPPIRPRPPPAQPDGSARARAARLVASRHSPTATACPTARRAPQPPGPPSNRPQPAGQPTAVHPPQPPYKPRPPARKAPRAHGGPPRPRGG